MINLKQKQRQISIKISCKADAKRILIKGSFVSFKKVVQIQRNNKSGNKKRGSYEAFQ